MTPLDCFSLILIVLIPTAFSELVYLQTVCRHGDRAPIFLYPNYEHSDKWPMGLGRLTEKGIQQCYNNGLMYREHYKDLFGEHYNSEKVRIQSSYIDRTIVSGQSFAAGFFLNSDYLPNLDSRTFMPYPVHQISEDIDYYLAGGRKLCPKLQTALSNYQQSREFSLFVAENEETINHICDKAGFPLDRWSLSCIRHLADTNTCDEAHGLSLPDWMDETVQEQVSNMTEFERKLALSQQEVQRFQVGGGAFINLILDNMRSFVNGSLNTTIFDLIYAHDTTLLGFLANMKYEHIQKNPEYTSCINMELHFKDGEYSVDILYKNETDRMAMKRLVPWGCPADDSCIWENFLTSMERLEIPNPAEACQPNDIVLELTLTSTNLIVFCVAISILMTTILTIAYSCGKNREANKIMGNGGVHYEPLNFMHDL
ncbi:prostatic acid phosphatase-like [Convolutriloba macropyga]|uniref:prostatic acid phosphatase-like n=1 Tax=Convolutriloba macropyga TaxID=536237 RepID=UPI003F51E99F